MRTGSRVGRLRRRNEVLSGVHLVVLWGVDPMVCFLSVARGLCTSGIALHIPAPESIWYEFRRDWVLHELETVHAKKEKQVVWEEIQHG